MYGRGKDGEQNLGLPDIFAPQTLTQTTIKQVDPGFISFLSKLPPKSPETGTLCIFCRTSGGDSFYAAYDADALFVAQNVFHTNSVIKCLRSGGQRGFQASV